MTSIDHWSSFYLSCQRDWSQEGTLRQIWPSHRDEVFQKLIKTIPAQNAFVISLKKINCVTSLTFRFESCNWERRQKPNKTNRWRQLHRSHALPAWHRWGWRQGVAETIVESLVPVVRASKLRHILSGPVSPGDVAWWLLTSCEAQRWLSRLSVCNKSALLFTLHGGRRWGLAHFLCADVQTRQAFVTFTSEVFFFFASSESRLVKKWLLWPLPVSAHCYYFPPHSRLLLTSDLIICTL